ncbi:MAG TPA: hypothetical protein PKZ84_17515 [Anaerolineae bacterium]|nr:hypothetical protein [Anaerolineae bacterium]HQI86454.1 hypothetical protein [Anaerolineae bacterium]
MKKWGLILICALALLWAPALAAQEGVSVSPRQLNIAVQQGQTETRVLLIRAADAVSDLRVIPLDLTNPNGDVILPAQAIQVNVPATNIAANGLLTVPVTFNLTNAPSGQFSGELLISYTGQSFTVPVTVAVKDKPWLPLAALVVGVALGIGVSTYRAQGRPRDEVLVRLGQIRTQMKADKELEETGAPFHARIAAHLVDVEVALEAQQWEKAQEAVRTAETLWVNWRRARPDWLVQLDYYARLNDKLTRLGENIFYISEVKEAALDAYRDMPNLEKPERFRENLERLTRQVNDFIALQERIKALKEIKQGLAAGQKLQERLNMLVPTDDGGRQSLQGEIEAATRKAQLAQLEENITQLTKMSARLSEAQAQVWGGKAQEFQARLTTLDPDDSAAYLTLENDINAALREMIMLAPAGESLRDAAATPFDVPIPKSPAQRESLLTSPPNTHVQPLAEKIAGAGWRLQAFTWLTYAVAVIALALAGFMELYGARLDFGANGIGDYFTLLAWGFGAEATRASIAEMVQGWSISTGK